MKKKILILVVILGIIAVSSYFYLYKNHRDIATEQADFSISVSALQKEFVLDANSANKKYSDKTIEVNGTITNIDLIGNAVVIDEKLFAVFKDSILNQLKINQQIAVKGRFLGYDDLLEEFRIDQVTVVE